MRYPTPTRRPPRMSTAVAAVVLVVAAGALVARPTTRRAPEPPPPATAATGRAAAIGAGFEPNVGQADSSVAFLARTGGYTLSLGPAGAQLALPGPAGGALSLHLAGAAPGARLEPADPLPGVVNDLTGADPSTWHTRIPTFGTVAARDALPGVDLVYHAAAGAFEYDVVVAPGTDPASVVLILAGGGKVDLDRGGDLVVTTPGGVVRQHAPVVYQETGGARQPIAGRFRLLGDGRVGFTVGPYDRSKPLVIDPSVTVTVTVPGTTAKAVAAGPSGDAFVAGSTSGSGRSGSIIGAGGKTDAFLARIHTDGSVAYTTFFGGKGDDVATAVAVDAAGRAFATGRTDSDDFPTTGNAFQPARTCDIKADGYCYGDAFLTELAPDGSQALYSTYFGGHPAPEEGKGVAVDPAGRVVVAGESGSTNVVFPTTAGAYREAVSHAEDPACNCSFQYGWVARFDTAASGSASLVASTLLEYPVESKTESGTFVEALAVGPDGSAYVTGNAGPGFPTTSGAFDAADPGSDAGGPFVTRFSPNLSSLVYSTHLGPATGGSGNAIAVDSAGAAYVAGTAGPGFPTANPLQGQVAGKTDAFVAKLDARGALLGFSTYLGGAGDETAQGVAVDTGGHAVVVGATGSSDFPTVNPVAGTSASGAFVASFEPDGKHLTYSSYLGGGGRATGVAIGSNGKTWVAEDDGVVVEVSSGPTVTGLLPNAGGTGGGTDVVVTGTDLSGATSVTFGAGNTVACGGSSAACQVDPASSGTRLVVTAPAHAAGTVPVAVTTAAGTSAASAAAVFTYRGPVVSSLDGATGPATGGTAVTLGGSDLQGATVTFGGVDATQVTAAADGSALHAVTPAHAVGQAPIAVTTASGDHAAAPQPFVYVPALTSLTPPSGQPAGGVTVTIAGRGLAGATAVRFGQEPPVAPTSVTDTQVVVTAPAHAKPETVSVTVSAGGADSVPVPAGANAFTYTTPVVTNPPQAQNNGAGTAKEAGGGQPAAPPSGGGNAAPTPNPGQAANANPAPAPGGASPSPSPSPAAQAPGGAGAATQAPGGLGAATQAPGGVGAAAQAPGAAAPAAGAAPTPVPGAAPGAAGATPVAPVAPVPAPVAAPGAAGAGQVAPTPSASPAAPGSASPVGNQGVPAAEPGGPSKGAPGYAMVARPQPGPPYGAALAGAAAVMAGAFGCLVLADRRRAARLHGRPAFAAVPPSPRR